LTTPMANVTIRTFAALFSILNRKPLALVPPTPFSTRVQVCDWSSVTAFAAIVAPPLFVKMNARSRLPARTGSWNDCVNGDEAPAFCPQFGPEIRVASVGAAMLLVSDQDRLLVRRRARVVVQRDAGRNHDRDAGAHRDALVEVDRDARTRRVTRDEE